MLFKVKHITIFALVAVLASCAAAGSTGPAAPIVKLGTADLSMVETTPVLWKGQLLRFESVRSDYNGISPRCDPASCGVPQGVRLAFAKRRELLRALAGWMERGVASLDSFHFRTYLTHLHFLREMTFCMNVSGPVLSLPGGRGQPFCHSSVRRWVRLRLGAGADCSRLAFGCGYDVRVWH